MKAYFSTELFEYCFTHSKDLLCFIDEEGIIQTTNPQWERSFGYPSSEIKGKPLTDFIHPEDLTEMNKVLLIGNNEYIPDIESRCKHKDGGYRWIEWQLIRLQGFIYLSGHDVSEHRLARNSRLQNNQLFENIYNLSPEIIVVTGLSDGAIFLANTSFSSILGYSREDYAGKTVFELEIWPKPNERKALIDELRTAGYIKNKEITLQTKDGKILTCLFSAKSLIYNDNKCMVAVVNDITERKKAENDLRESESRLRNFIDESSQGIVMTNEDGLVIEWNNSAIGITGYSREDILNCSWWELTQKIAPDHIKSSLSKELPEAKVKEFSKSGNTRTPPRNDYPIQSADETIKYIEHNIFTIKTSKGYCIAGIFSDITEKIKIKNELLLSEEKFSLAFKTTPDAVNINRLSDGLFIETNQGFTDSTGYTFEDVKGKTSLEIKIWADPSERDRLINELLKSGKITNFEAQFRRKDGGISVGLMSAALITLQDEKCLLTITRDITERKQFEEVLKKSEARLQKAQAVGKIGYSEQVLGGQYMWNSAEAMRIYGFPPIEGFIPIEQIYDLIPDFEHIRKKILTMLRQGKNPDIEFILNPADGSAPRYIHVVSEIEYDKKGKPFKILNILQDITARKQAEEALAFEHSQMLSIFDGLDVIFYVSDPVSYEILFANKTLKEERGKELVGGTCYREFQGLDAPCPFCTNEIILKHKYEAYRWEYYNPVMNLTFDIHDRIIRWPDGRNVRLELAIDISERIRATGKIKQLSDLQQTILDTINVGLTLVKDRKQVWVNPAICKIFGYNMQELIGSPTSIYYTKSEDYEFIGEKGYSCLSTGQVFTTEIQFKRKDGMLLWIKLSGKAVNPKNIKEGSIWMLQDITEGKIAADEIRDLNTRLEARVRERTAQLEQANKDLEAFAYSVSHDLRAPLRHIDGFIRIMYSCISDPSEAVKGYYEKITSASRRMSSMIDELLAFSRLGRKELKMVPVDLNVLVNEVVEQLKPDYANRIIKWKISKIPVLHGYKALLKIVFENLISNAIKYTSKKRVAIIDIGLHAETENQVEIYIRDNGTGFDMTHANKLFGVFQRLHDTEDYDGIGIGLANVKQIIDRHKGSIRAEGKPDEGATFYITLPKH